MRLVVLGFVFALCGCVSTAQKLDLRSELEAIYDTDQELRGRLQELMVKSGGKSEEGLRLWKQQQKVDEENLRRLEKIIKDSGWPDRRVLGDKAAAAAFLVIQHSDYSHQKQYLPVLRTAVTDGKARPEDLALLEDRVLMNEGKKQRYGSQLREDGKGGWEFYPIEDEANVDKRRKAVGLGPLSEYAKLFGFEYSAK